ncbi:MAG: AAA family ATPase [Lentisphaerae bacterium GWF2_44_16]|nr:MAG: AAA family ATPase [Lentisphaerae bacterium GWF2_44_16]
MIPRQIQSELALAAKEYPVVTISGPRQSGKTTLARMQFPDYSYANLESPELRRLATNDPLAFFARHPAPMIIDEVQRAPELLSYIQTISDKSKKRGQYILTGSHQLRLHEAVSQSLAGRTALLRLLPLSLEELKNNNLCNMDWNMLIYHGFMPRLYEEDIDPARFYRNYFQTYVERDVRQMINVKSLIAFESFMRLLAGRIGQIVNLHSLSSDVGVSSTTLKEWVSVLEASFVIFRLPPYFENFGKRIIKSPKIYFTEIGLAAYLLGIEKPEHVTRDPLRGNLFENMVVLEALKTRFNAGTDPNLFFFRDNKGNEVDLIFKKGRQLIPVEIKSSMTFNSDFTKGIDYFRKIARDAVNGTVIYNGEMTGNISDTRFINFVNTSEIFSEPD